MQLIAEQQYFKDSLAELYYDSANQNQKYWVRDNASSLKIQSKFRMYIERKKYLEKKAATIKIQKTFRAFNARKTFKQKQVEENNKKNLEYFAKQATMIQKVFRGFFVRKYIHNFYLRKQELEALAQKNEQFRKQLEQFGKAQAIESEEYRQEQAKMQFASLAKNLHHLTSTKNIPGVYNSPFVLQKPAVFEKTVQDHLSHEFKSSYKWRPPKREQIMKYSIRPASRKVK